MSHQIVLSKVNFTKFDVDVLFLFPSLTDYAGNESHLSLSQQLLVGHKVLKATAKDSPKRPGTEGVKSPSQIPGQSPSHTSAEQDWRHQGPEESDFRPPAQVPTVPHPMTQ